VHGEATNGTGVKGTGQSIGVHATISGGGYWPTGLKAETDDLTRGNGVETYGGTGVYANGHNYGVEAIAEYTGGGVGVYAYGTEYAGYFDGDVYVNGTVDDGSDLALKENVRSLPYGLSAVMSLEPKAYEMKQGVTRAKLQGTRLGLIAQQVQSVVPEVVKRVKTPIPRNPEGKPDPTVARPEFLSVSYTALIPILIKAIQEQQARIEALEAQLQGR
jgi:hypothetical protein